MNTAQFIEYAVKKYDKGQKEHGGLITDRDMPPEERAEITDLWHYITADILKHLPNRPKLNTPEEIRDWSIARFLRLHTMHNMPMADLSEFSRKEILAYGLIQELF